MLIGGGGGQEDVEMGAEEGEADVEIRANENEVELGEAAFEINDSGARHNVVVVVVVVVVVFSCSKTYKCIIRASHHHVQTPYTFIGIMSFKY